MRTTLTLDPDVAMLLKKELARSAVSFKDAVNDALRRGLLAAAPQKSKRVFKQRTWDFGPVPSPAEVKDMLLKEDVERFLRASGR